MDISKHPVLKKIHDSMGMVEELGASDELTALSVQLGEVLEDVERVVDDSKAKDEFIPYCG